MNCLGAQIAAMNLFQIEIENDFRVTVLDICRMLNVCFYWMTSDLQYNPQSVVHWDLMQRCNREQGRRRAEALPPAPGAD